MTLTMCLVGALPWMRGVLLTVTQLLGAILAAAVVNVVFPGHLTLQTALSSGASVVKGFLIEMFLTFQLVITLPMLAAEKHAATFIAPVDIGLSLFISELSGVHFTNGSLNPARSFAPGLVFMDFASNNWLYRAGPIAGGLLAAGLYKLLKTQEFEEANPGQDAGKVDGGYNDEGQVRLRCYLWRNTGLMKHLPHQEHIARDGYRKSVRDQDPQPPAVSPLDAYLAKGLFSNTVIVSRTRNRQPLLPRHHNAVVVCARL